MSSKNKSTVAIITMCFLFAMISFVTNMAAPFGTIWKGSYEWAGMVGNLMNFAAYLFMGIPAGKMLLKLGYKKTTLVAIATGFVGMFVQWLSSRSFAGESAIFIYLAGAFICGFCVCMLNTVVNPALNLLGGGGNKGNQYVQIGGTVNSLTGTLTPLLAGALIGTVITKADVAKAAEEGIELTATSMSSVAPLLYIAMGVFLVSFIIISFVNMPEPAQDRKNVKYEHSAWNFRHLVLGVVAIFFYVGVEVGIPGELLFYFSDATEKGAGVLVNGALIGGAIAAIYWLLMMIGRIISSAISSKVSTKTQLTVVSVTAIVFLLLAIFIPKSVTVDMPAFLTAKAEKALAERQAAAEKTVTLEEAVEAVETEVVEAAEPVDGTGASKLPIHVVFIVLCGLCTSLMWGAIFNLATEGLGKYTEQASGIFMTMVVGGGIMPFLQERLGNVVGYMNSYWLVIAMIAFILFYALVGCKNVNTDIPTE